MKMEADQLVSGLKLFLHDNSTYHQIKVIVLGLYTVSLAILSLFQAFSKVQFLKPVTMLFTFNALFLLLEAVLQR
jgi:hypothetical protein